MELPERPGIGTNELVSSFVLCLFTSGNVANVPFLLFLGNLDERTWNRPNDQELNERTGKFVRLVFFTLGNVTNVSLSFF